MSNVNKATLLGNLCRDPELRHMQNGDSVCSLRIATSEKWKGRDGEPQEKTEYHDVSVFGPSADACATYLEKGRLVYVEGKIETREVEKDGVTKYYTGIKVSGPMSTIKFLGGGGEAKSAPQRQQPAPTAPPADLDVTF